MSDWTVSELAEHFKSGRLTRRQFVARMIGAGLSAPVIASVLAACGSSTKSGSSPQSGSAPSGATADNFQPTKRGGGGTLKLLWWQGATILNGHFSTGTKDQDASRIFLEPLAAYDPDGKSYPVLAAEIPSVDKGTLDKDGKWVTWRLKKGVQWHDGQPFNADDVIFTWQYVVDPATATVNTAHYSNITTIDKVDDYTVKVTFKDPTPYWQNAFHSTPGSILPKHILQSTLGKDARNAPFNLKPVGTGPYKVVDFRPGDMVIAEINPNYHVDNRPYFDRIELKGGGDATSAARAVLQTGDYDFAWNTFVADDLLQSMEKTGIGKVVIIPPNGTETIHLNFSDPNTEVDGERSSLKSKHPFFSDLKVRQAFALAVDRQLIADQLYGRLGSAASYSVVNPKTYLPDGKFEYNLQKAAQMLDDAGWKKGSDGVRAKDGKRMHVVFQTTVNDIRQNTQAIVKKDLESIGVQVELKSINDNVFFGNDPGNPDSQVHFYADMQMYTSGFDADPQTYMRSWVASLDGSAIDNVAQKSNSWSKPNYERYQSADYDKLWRQALVEFDPAKRADLFKQMQKLLISDATVIPIVNRNGARAAKNGLTGMDLGAFDSDMWKLPYWHRTA
jgi:peptide/nickel transport system substrate-binding protein